MRVDVTEIKSFIRQSETVAVEFDGDDELRLNVDAYIVVSIATSTPFIVHCSSFRYVELGLSKTIGTVE